MSTSRESSIFVESVEVPNNGRLTPGSRGVSLHTLFEIFQMVDNASEEEMHGKYILVTKGETDW